MTPSPPVVHAARKSIKADYVKEILPYVSDLQSFKDGGVTDQRSLAAWLAAYKQDKAAGTGAGTTGEAGAGTAGGSNLQEVTVAGDVSKVRS